MPEPQDSLFFYMIGRDHPLDDEFDVDELAQRVVAGEKVRDVAHAAAVAADLPKKTPENRKLWAKKREIKGALEDSLLDEASAYGFYHDGVIDQTAHDLEPDILEAIDEIFENGDDDDEDLAEGDDGPTSALPS